jgi:hypothetical protein
MGIAASTVRLELGLHAAVAYFHCMIRYDTMRYDTIRVESIMTIPSELDVNKGECRHMKAVTASYDPKSAYGTTQNQQAIERLMYLSSSHHDAYSMFSMKSSI